MSTLLCINLFLICTDKPRKKHKEYCTNHTTGHCLHLVSLHEEIVNIQGEYFQESILHILCLTGLNYPIFREGDLPYILAIKMLFILHETEGNYLSM